MLGSLVIVSLISSLCSVASASLSEGLVGYWTFNEGSGTEAADSSGNGRVGELRAPVGGTIPTWTSDGISGHALTFGGSGYVDLANTADLNFGTSGFTLAAWVRYNTLTAADHMIVGKHSGGYPNGYCLDVGYAWWSETANKVAFCFNQDPRLLSPATYDDGQWHLVVGTSDGTAGSLYIDGQLIGSNLGAPFDSPADMLIGGCFMSWDNSFAAGFIGDIDEVRIYNRALSGNEIAELRLVPAPGAALLGALGLSVAGWRLRRRME